jgi:hypothetical protein
MEHAQEMQEIKRSEAPMSSSREPIYQLEPSNLLEPLDLAEQPVESIRRPAHPDYGTSKPAATPAMPRDRAAPPIGRGRRRLKSALLVAGALGCIAVGTALPRMTTLVWGDVDPQAGLARTLAGVTRLSERAADVVVKPDAPKTAATATASKEAAAANASDQPPPPANPSHQSPAPANASNQPAAAANTSNQPPAPANASRPSAAPTAKEAKEAKAAQCNQHAASDNKCLEGAVAVAPAPASQPVTINPPPSAPADPQAATPPAAPPQAATAQPAESPPVGARASVQQEERSQASRQSRRAARRDTNRTPAPRRDWAAADTAPAERYTERWEDRDVDRSFWRRDWGADDRAAGQRSWDNWQARDRWQARDANRESSWGRDRYDDYARGDGRRAVERNWRSDDRPIARSSREEVPVMPAPQFRFGW